MKLHYIFRILKKKSNHNKVSFFFTKKYCFLDLILNLKFTLELNGRQKYASKIKTRESLFSLLIFGC